MSVQARIAAKKHLGQNFLTNKQMQAKIAATMATLVHQYPNLPVVEVGPGRGDLTRYFVEFDHPFHAIEIDPDLEPTLIEQFSAKSNFHLHIADFVDVLPELSEKMLSNQPSNFILLSNLPFNVGSRILVDLALYAPQAPFGIILQKEVCDKLSSTSNFTLFGSFLSLFWNFQQKFSIAPNNFYPQPNVQSALVLAQPHATLPHFLQSVEQRQKVLELFKILFSQPSKTLWNNLKLSPLSKEQMEELYQAQNWPQTLRLGWDNYQHILVAILEKLS